MTAPSGERIARAAGLLEALDTEIRKVFVGQDDLVRGVLLGLLARGNLLLEGAPGLGKTLLVRVLSQAMQLSFSRIQFTPDLMPADITGTTTLIASPDGSHELRFRRGPIFAQIVLADEINRGTPKTQSALLEAMQEHAVTASGQHMVLEEPFMVLATQNPIEMEGTYPLPEAQLDRFLLKLVVPYPSMDALMEIGTRTTGAPLPEIEPVIDRDQVLALQALTREIVVAPHVARYAAALTMATHPDSDAPPGLVGRFVRYGASPRAMQSLLLAGRALALSRGRAFLSPDDVAEVTPAVLRHRIILSFDADLEGVDADRLVAAVLETTPRPR